MIYNDAWLAHHGVQGQKWGVRRYQNPDGSYKRGFVGNLHRRAEARAVKSNHSTGKIIARTIIKDAIIGAIDIAAAVAINVAAANISSELGQAGVLMAGTAAGVGIAAAGAYNTAVGITSAIQNSRGAYNRK